MPNDAKPKTPLQRIRQWFAQRLGAKANGKKPNPTLRPVVTGLWLAEYRGTVTSGARTAYALFTAKISHQARQALLAEGFRCVGVGKFPTHTIYCTHQVWIDKGRTRLLFNIVFCLDGFIAPAQDKAALEITQFLRVQLERCPHPQFVIRKRTRAEFPWPQEDGELDEYWLTNATVAYLSVMRRFSQLGLTIEELTEIQEE